MATAVIGSGDRVCVRSPAPCHFILPFEFAFFFPEFFKCLLHQCQLSSHFIYKFFWDLTLKLQGPATELSWAIIFTLAMLWKHFFLLCFLRREFCCSFPQLLWFVRLFYLFFFCYSTECVWFSKGDPVKGEGVPSLSAQGLIAVCLAPGHRFFPLCFSKPRLVC